MASFSKDVQPAANSQASGITVPAHFVPTPATVSPQAQAFLSSPPPVGLSALPDVKDKAAWRAYVAENNRHLTAFSARYARRYPGKVDTHSLSASPLYEIVPQTFESAHAERAILYIHGGGFFSGGGMAAVHAAMPLASLSGMRTFSVDYRMPPDFPYPAAMDDCVESYRYLLGKYKPQNIAIYGPSAGGNLAPVTILKARDMGLALPAVCALHSPASDLTESGDTYNTNQTVDIVLQHRSPALFELYTDGKHDLRDPLVSPLYADFTKGFPPTILTSGTRDLLLSSTVLLHRALRRAGVTAELHVWEAMTHGLFFDAPEEHEVYAEQVRFMLLHLGG